MSVIKIVENITVSETTFTEAYLYDCSLRLHVNGAIGIPLDIFATYLVIYHSPPSMGSYKYYLLNIIFWSFVFDLDLALIFTPVPLYPALSICTAGVLRNLGAGIHYVSMIFVIQK